MRNLRFAIVIIIGAALVAVASPATAADTRPTQAQTLEVARIVDAAGPIINRCTTVTCVNVAMWNTYFAARKFSKGLIWMAAKKCPAQAPFAKATARYLTAATTSHAMPRSRSVARDAVIAYVAFEAAVNKMSDCAPR